jgi:ammonia channel protein AmtB
MLLLWQLVAVLACSAWASVWTFIIFKLTAKVTPIRASEACEEGGLDAEYHGEM